MFGEFWEKEAKKFREDIKQTLHSQFNLGFDHEDQWKAHVESLLVQGHMLGLESADHGDAICKNYFLI